MSAEHGTATEPTRKTRTTGGYGTLLYAAAKKRAMLLKRYPMNTISGILSVVLVFTVVFFGGSALSGQALTDSLGGIIVGFFLWTLAMTSFSGLAWSVTRESQWGTLEQLYMSPFGFGRVMFANIVVRVAESFLWGAIALAFMLALTGESLHLNVVTIVVLGVLAVAPAVGLGYVFGGLALIYKRVENIFQIVQFIFIGLIAAPVGGSFYLRLLPVSQGSYLLTRAMRDGLRIWEIPPFELAVLAGTAVVYFGLGYAVFHLASAHARKKGLMGHY